MSIVVQPGQTFGASASGFTTGLVGTIGVQIIDDSGNVVTARTTSGIVEFPAASGNYSAGALTAPTNYGYYQVVWNSGSVYASEDLQVTYSQSSSPAPGGGGGLYTVSQLHGMARRMVGDYGTPDQLTATLSSTSSTTLTVADNSLYRRGLSAVIDDEMMYVTGTSGTTAVNVLRGWKGTPPATHANSSWVYIDPTFSPQDFVDGLNSGLRKLYPHYFQTYIDSTITVTDITVADYALPGVFADDDSRVTMVQYLESGMTSDLWTTSRNWEIRRASYGAAGTETNTIHFKWVPPLGSTVKIIGMSPWKLSLVSGSGTGNLHDRACLLLPTYACGYVYEQYEATRLRNAHAENIGQFASQPGQALNLAHSYYARFWDELAKSGGQPWPRWYTTRMF